MRILGSKAPVALTERPALAESLAFRGSKPLQWRAHLARLAEGCRAMGWADPQPRPLLQACLKAIRASRLKAGSLRLRYWSGWQGEEPVFLAQALPLRPLPEAWKKGLRLMTSAVRHYGSASLQGRLKASAMLANWLAGAEVQAWADDGLRLTPDGLVAEGVWSNIVARKGRVVRTPPLHQGVLEGVTRAQLLRRFGKKYQVREEPLTRYDLWTADEVWVCSSLRGPLKVREVDGRPLPLV
jgi:branched-subunit amino acid aminotransferase/4-amino-4-deoxychorismate lyase